MLVWFLSVSSSSWCLGRAAICNCDTPWTSLLPFFPMSSRETTCGFGAMLQSTASSINLTVLKYNADANIMM